MRICFFLCLVQALAWTACTYDHGDGEPCPLPNTVSFSQDIQPVFNAHCNIPDCHSGISPQANFNLEPGVAYAQLHEPGSGYIDTVQPNFSLLYAQMISVSQPMPPSGRLDECTTDLVLKWIEQKAKNN